MNMKKIILILSLTFCINLLLQAQESKIKIDTIVYKKIDTSSLIMKIVYPPNFSSSETYPAMVFFFGGGWKRGNIGHFEMQADYFARRGIICFLADYRVESRHGATIVECVMDARSAIRYLRKNTDRFSIDGNKIIAAGGSSGGQLAAATAISNGPDESTDDISISPFPNALVLFNPAIDLGPGTGLYEKRKLGEIYQSISPLHIINKETPPTILFLGTEDKYIPVDDAKKYKQKIDDVGSRCELFLYEGQQHGFFNYSRSEEHYKKTVYEADKFLISLGYLDGEPTIMNKK
jgi:acetyl esterase